MAETLDLDAIKARCEAATRKLSALCLGRERWRMSIPAQPDDDPDLVIGKALWDIEALIAESQQLRRRMESLAREIEGERIDYTADVDLGYNDGLEVAAELVRLTVASEVTADV